MKNYICEPCNFTSINKTNYNNHLHTKTHINNITPKDKFCCDVCLNIFNCKSSLYKHHKTCKLQKNTIDNNRNNNINSNNNDNTNNIDINNVDPMIELLLLKQKVKFLEEKAALESKLLNEKKEIESKLIKAELESKLNSKLIRAELESKLNSKLIKEKTENKMLQKQSKEKTKLIKENNKLLLKSKDEQIDLVQKKSIESIRQAYSEGKMNAMTFVTQCYNKTPKMIPLSLESEHVVADVKSDKKINYWIKKKPDSADEYIAERLLHIYDGKEFSNYITNIIVKAYKKDDPAEQTFWASDVSRLIYIVRSTFNQKDEWVYDKKGLIIKESIIDPLLEEVNNIIIKYHKYMEDRYLHSTIKQESDYYMEKLPVLKVAEKLINDFKNRQSVKNQIIRVLAPKFYLDRDVEKDKNKIQNKKYIDKQKQIEYEPPKIENNTIFDKIKKKKLEELKQIEESSEDTEEFLNDPRVKAKMERERLEKENKKIKVLTQIEESSEDTEEFLNDPRVKAKMERERLEKENKKIKVSSHIDESSEDTNRKNIKKRK